MVWYLWLILGVVILTLLLVAAVLVQRRRRGGGVLSARPRPRPHA